MKLNNYSDALEFLYHQLPMFSKTGASAYKKDLTNTLELCQILGNPHHQFKSIHIAGTNGKGSVSHMLAAVFQQNGFKTGLYTSPHLKDFRERIKINGLMIPPDFVVEFLQKIELDAGRIQPSFFEMTVAMAFSYFAQQKVEVAIVEVGLGGRLDSTNIITPELSVITNISFDHQNLLGDTLELIASEKAGIIKKGIPVLIGETQQKLIPVFLSKATSVDAPIYFAEQLFKITNTVWSLQNLQVSVQGPLSENFPDRESSFLLDLNGSYQEKNLLTLLGAVEILRNQGWNLRPEPTREALGKVKQLTGLRGRWDLVSNDPLIILDVAHNEAGIEQVIQQLTKMTFQELHLIIGFVKDKDIQPVLKILPKKARYYFCKADIPRALPENELFLMAKEYGLSGEAFPTVMEALQKAKLAAKGNDFILVLGSCYIVGEVEEGQFKSSDPSF
ncbi:MAG: bifunctional folylpolyglutamate synthase/dihydrofolate synthase [Chitinophagaceae bacterium]